MKDKKVKMKGIFLEGVIFFQSSESWWSGKIIWLSTEQWKHTPNSMFENHKLSRIICKLLIYFILI